jgi:hypothetical protein
MTTDTFTCVRVEGSILPTDLLQRVAAGDARLEGLRVEDYGLVGEKVNEATNHAWTRLSAAWDAFKAAKENLPPTDTGHKLTIDRWLLPFWKVLGYSTLDKVTQPFVIDEKTYPVSHVRHHSPFHLVSFRQDLDKRSETDGKQFSPHGLVQEFLNRSEAHLWGFVSNGLKLRILRDNIRLTRQAFVEFDLQAMFDGKQYADFALLWRLCHESRVNSEKPEECWLERWSTVAAEQGLRALDQLRTGVENAVKALGRGFLACPANAELKAALKHNRLTPLEYYRQLLRVVYRFLFLFVAEDRELLCDPAAGDEAKNRYTNFYSAARLRRIAERLRGSPHTDLYEGFSLVLDKLGTTGCPDLGLPALGGLFDPARTPNLTGCRLANADLLEAVRALSVINDGNARRSVDYRNLGAEELGSVYESLLELQPRFDPDAVSFTLESAGGNERKTTGSYYTPTSLITCLLDSALDPVLAEAAKGSREWDVGSREWDVGSREWDVGSREWDVGSREWDVGSREKSNDSVVSRPSGLADGSENRQGGIPRHQEFSERRTLRTDESNSTSSYVDPGEHRGGLRTRINPGLHPLPADSTGKPQGTGNTFLGRSGGGDSFTGTAGHLQPDGSSRKDAAGTDSFLGDQANITTTPHSLLPIPSSAEERILALKVCDPACGSGHFLIAAAHRIAKKLASVRTHEEEPAPAEVRHALRDVIGRCIYGVDINPMAVELCQVALWMEALEPGKPLSFLDHHIQCGNSLLGTTPALLAKGIPDEAFEPIEGDDKKVCSALKRQNKEDRRNQPRMFEDDLKPWEQLGNLPAAMAKLEGLPDDTVERIREKERQYAALKSEAAYRTSGCFLADAWCAAFVWKKVKDDNLLPMTEGRFRRIEKNPHDIGPQEFAEVRRLADQYQFFHWHLAFPGVFRYPAKNESPDNELTGWCGGFDVVLGNPPWERIKLQEQEWFAAHGRPDIAGARTASIRGQMIRKLETTDPALYRAFLDDRRRAEGESHLVRDSSGIDEQSGERRGLFPLCGRGDVNTYSLFAELNRNLIRPTGRVGCIVPSGIATDDTTKLFFQDLAESRTLASLFDFENRDAIFPGVHRSYKFALLTLSGSARPVNAANFVFFAHQVKDLEDPGKRFTLSPDDLALLNPNTRTCPVFRTAKDAELTKAIYRRVPVLLKEGAKDGNPWGVSFLRMLDMASDSGLFRTTAELATDGWRLDGNVFRKGDAEYLPLYEAKMLHQFDHRWATYDGTDSRDVTPEEKADPRFVVTPRYWVPASEVAERLKDRWDRRWLFGWRDICRNTDIRTTIAGILPQVGVGHKAPLFLPNGNAIEAACLYASLCSFVFDYVSRQKVGSTTMAIFILKQLPVLPPATYAQPCPWDRSQTLADWIKPCVLELTYTAHDLKPFAEDLGYAGDPFFWDDARRAVIRAELDAAFFHLYGISEPDADYILDTFPIVKAKDEERFGTYRTKETILRCYQEMQEAIADPTGQTVFASQLDPPPGSSR